MFKYGDAVAYLLARMLAIFGTGLYLVWSMEDFKMDSVRLQQSNKIDASTGE